MLETNWWRDAVIYQVYPRSFADGNGDGIGDLAGVRAKLPYLKELGIDAIWFNPWYASPQADAGYDVSDYRAIDPIFGTLDEAEHLIAEAHELGLRIIVDIVPNHVSDQHPWFQEALRGLGRDRFWFRDEPANHWVSQFGGGTWTQVADGQYYLHLFDGAQPDLNWDHPEVRAEFEAVLRFWFDRGADGIRIDSAGLLCKDPALPEVDAVPVHPFSDRDDVHEIYRSWRRIADEYGDRALIGEVWLPDPVRFANYLRPDEMHTAFNLDFLCAPWDAAKLHAVIDSTLANHAPVGAPATWVLSNHDVTRHVTRYGRRTRRSASPPSATTPRPTLSSARGGRGRPCFWHWPCPVRPMCTRAKNSASGRWKTSRRPCVRTRCGIARATPIRAATAAGCRSRGRATPRRSGSARQARRRSRGYHNRPRGRRTQSRHSPATRIRCSSFTGRRCACGAGFARSPSRGTPPPPACLPSPVDSTYAW
jgi:glycosidase